RRARACDGDGGLEGLWVRAVIGGGIDYRGRLAWRHVDGIRGDGNRLLGGECTRRDSATDRVLRQVLHPGGCALVGPGNRRGDVADRICVAVRVRVPDQGEPGG